METLMQPAVKVISFLQSSTQFLIIYDAEFTVAQKGIACGGEG